MHARDEIAVASLGRRLPIDAGDLRDPCDFLREEVVPRFGDAHVVPHGEDPFRASLKVARVGRLEISEIRASAMTFERTSRHAARAPQDGYTIGLLLAGHGEVVQRGDGATVGPGDLVVCDAQLPMRLRFEEPFHQLVFSCDRAPLEARVPDVARRTVRPVHGRGALARAAASYVATVAGACDPTAEVASIVPSHVLDMLAIALRGGPAIEPARRNLLARARAYVEENLASRDLTPASVAQHHRVSLRYLYEVFADEGETVAALIRRRRLARCRSLLADPLAAQRGIAEIAYEWGFNDATTFTRAFRQAFGASPRHFRAMALATGRQASVAAAPRRRCGVVGAGLAAIEAEARGP